MTTRALKKTPECFAQLAHGLSKLELHWDSRRYDAEGNVSVPLSYQGQPVLLCFPPERVLVPPQQRPVRGEDFSMALGIAEPEGSDLVRSLRHCLCKLLGQGAGTDKEVKVIVTPGGNVYKRSLKL